MSAPLGSLWLALPFICGCDAQDAARADLSDGTTALSESRDCKVARESSYSALYKARSFPVAGFEPSRPPYEVVVLRCLTEDPNVERILVDLTGSGTDAGKLFGLVGLRVKDSRLFETTVVGFFDDPRAVDMSGSDHVMPRAVGSVAKSIAAWAYVADILPKYAQLVPSGGAEIAPERGPDHE